MMTPLRDCLMEKLSAEGFNYTLSNEGGGKGSYTDTTGNKTWPYGIKSTPAIEKEFSQWKGDPDVFWKSQAGKAYNMAQAGVNKHLMSQKIPSLGSGAMTALHDMGYNMGPQWMGKFPKFTNSLKTYTANPTPQGLDSVIGELKNSQWARQVPNRAARNMELIRGSLSKMLPNQMAGSPPTMAKANEEVDFPNPSDPNPQSSDKPGQGDRSYSARKEPYKDPELSDLMYALGGPPTVASKPFKTALHGNAIGTVPPPDHQGEADTYMERGLGGDINKAGGESSLAVLLREGLMKVAARGASAEARSFVAERPELVGPTGSFQSLSEFKRYMNKKPANIPMREWMRQFTKGGVINWDLVDNADSTKDPSMDPRHVRRNAKAYSRRVNDQDPRYLPKELRNSNNSKPSILDRLLKLPLSETDVVHKNPLDVETQSKYEHGQPTNENVTWRGTRGGLTTPAVFNPAIRGDVPVAHEIFTAPTPAGAYSDVGVLHKVRAPVATYKTLNERTVPTAQASNEGVYRYPKGSPVVAKRIIGAENVVKPYDEGRMRASGLLPGGVNEGVSFRKAPVGSLGSRAMPDMNIKNNVGTPAHGSRVFMSEGWSPWTHANTNIKKAGNNMASFDKTLPGAWFKGEGAPPTVGGAVEYGNDVIAGASTRGHDKAMLPHHVRDTAAVRPGEAGGGYRYTPGGDFYVHRPIDMPTGNTKGAPALAQALSTSAETMNVKNSVGQMPAWDARRWAMDTMRSAGSPYIPLGAAAQKPGGAAFVDAYNKQRTMLGGSPWIDPFSKPSSPLVAKLTGAAYPSESVYKTTARDLGKGLAGTLSGSGEYLKGALSKGWGAFNANMGKAWSKAPNMARSLMGPNTNALISGQGGPAAMFPSPANQFLPPMDSFANGGGSGRLGATMIAPD